MDVTQLALTWLGRQMLKNLFDLDQSERKSSQVNASARKAWPNGVTSRLLVTPFGQGLSVQKFLNNCFAGEKIVQFDFRGHVAGAKLSFTREK